jgi:hypothetical protein
MRTGADSRLLELAADLKEYAAADAGLSCVHVADVLRLHPALGGRRHPEGVRALERVMWRRYGQADRPDHRPHRQPAATVKGAVLACGTTCQVPAAMRSMTGRGWAGLVMPTPGTRNGHRAWGGRSLAAGLVDAVGLVGDEVDLVAVEVVHYDEPEHGRVDDR